MRAGTRRYGGTPGGRRAPGVVRLAVERRCHCERGRGREEEGEEFEGSGPGRGGTAGPGGCSGCRTVSGKPRSLAGLEKHEVLKSSNQH